MGIGVGWEFGGKFRGPDGDGGYMGIVTREFLLKMWGPVGWKTKGDSGWAYGTGR